MTAPFDQQAMRERHRKEERESSLFFGDCRVCRQPWPCDAIQALDALGEARRERDEYGVEAGKAVDELNDTIRSDADELDRRQTRISALEADLAAMRGTLESVATRLRDRLEIFIQERDGGRHEDQRVLYDNLIEETRRHCKWADVALASSPGAAWLATAREVVEALERVLDVHTIVYVGPEAKAAVALAEQQARALLARPEVQGMRGR